MQVELHKDQYSYDYSVASDTQHHFHRVSRKAGSQKEALTCLRTDLAAELKLKQREICKLQHESVLLEEAIHKTKGKEAEL